MGILWLLIEVALMRSPPSLRCPYVTLRNPQIALVVKNDGSRNIVCIIDAGHLALIDFVDGYKSVLEEK